MESINKMILDELEEVDAEENTKKFLNGILLFELQNIRTGGTRWGKEYDRLIAAHVGEDKE